MPKVSVIISIYQPERRYLSKQLMSIDAQQYDDMEIVVYDDCPEDDSWEDFCRTCCVRHPMRYHKGESNLGYVKAFEHLVGLADGQYLALSDQDDIWLPGRIAQGVEMLDAGYLLVCCDRQIIDGEDRVKVESWRATHPSDESVTWHTGDHFTCKAAFTCYSLGMATMLRADVARSLAPFPTFTGHDKWLALGASALGDCANIESPLVQYRQHGDNQTGVMRGIDCKQDWYRKRTRDTYLLVKEFAERFPESPDVGSMLAFAEARLRGDVVGIWRNRALAPQVASFEIALHFMPDGVFRALLGLLRRR